MRVVVLEVYCKQCGSQFTVVRSPQEGEGEYKLVHIKRSDCPDSMRVCDPPEFDVGDGELQL